MEVQEARRKREKRKEKKKIKKYLCAERNYTGMQSNKQKKKTA